MTKEHGEPPETLSYTGGEPITKGVNRVAPTSVGAQDVWIGNDE